MWHSQAVEALSSLREGVEALGGVYVPEPVVRAVATPDAAGAGAVMGATAPAPCAEGASPGARGPLDP